MPIKSGKMKISKNKKMRFFLMSQGSLNPKIRFLGQKLCPVARSQTHRQTDIQTDIQSNYWGHPFRIFSFNLSSRIGPIIFIFMFPSRQFLIVWVVLIPIKLWMCKKKSTNQYGLMWTYIMCTDLRSVVLRHHGCTHACTFSLIPWVRVGVSMTVRCMSVCMTVTPASTHAMFWIHTHDKACE